MHLSKSDCWYLPPPKKKTLGTGKDSFKFCPPGASANHFQTVHLNVENEREKEEFGSLAAGQLTELESRQIFVGEGLGHGYPS